ncbi:MAG: 3-dehydroquinate synthase, partial [Chitinophagales bacterium]|nr:3-dehydroquinate synthase [Chitinophagales bacterium]
MKHIKGKHGNIYFNDWSALKQKIQATSWSKIFVLVDENTEKYCLFHLLEQMDLPIHVIKIPSGEQHKNLNTCQLVWQNLMAKGADRLSLLINLGGGVIGDLGGFCAGTYMRGIRFIQIPTTLLSQVDASVGGKLGVDFMERKNMIGLFGNPEAVFIFTDFLKTLPERELKSGYAEMLKHALIADKDAWNRLSKTDVATINDWESTIYESVMIKQSIIQEDPLEAGKRKILNFGHTVGHAIESYWISREKPLLHGEAIAIGMVAEA